MVQSEARPEAARHCRQCRGVAAGLELLHFGSRGAGSVRDPIPRGPADGSTAGRLRQRSRSEAVPMHVAFPPGRARTNKAKSLCSCHLTGVRWRAIDAAPVRLRSAARLRCRRRAPRDAAQPPCMAARRAGADLHAGNAAESANLHHPSAPAAIAALRTEADSPVFLTFDEPEAYASRTPEDERRREPRIFRTVLKCPRPRWEARR